MDGYIGPPLDYNSDDGVKTPLCPTKAAYSDQPPLLTPSTAATSISSLSAMSPQTSVNSGTEPTINFAHVSDLNPKSFVHDDSSLTGLTLSPVKILKRDTSQENPDAKLTTDVDSSDEGSIDKDPLIAHPTEFQWNNPSIIKEACEKILRHKSMDMKAKFTIGESIDVILDHRSAIDLRITLASVRPGSNTNITKPQLKNSIKRVVMKKFYSA